MVELKRSLFLDLDGVFADFDGFIGEKFGIYNNREKEHPDFWKIVGKWAGRLYFDMKPLPYATFMWDNLKHYNPSFLTGCPTSIPGAAEDKREWVKKYIDEDAPVITCKSKEKYKFGMPGDILLDDWLKWRHLWVEMGGIFRPPPGRSIKVNRGSR